MWPKCCSVQSTRQAIRALFVWRKCLRPNWGTVCTSVRAWMVIATRAHSACARSFSMCALSWVFKWLRLRCDLRAAEDVRPESSRQVHGGWFCQGQMPVLRLLSYLCKLIEDLATLRHVHGVRMQRLLSCHIERCPHWPIMQVVSTTTQVDHIALCLAQLLMTGRAEGGWRLHFAFFLYMFVALLHRAAVPPVIHCAHEYICL